jgi:exopolyphosphatase / guanosine-5'-triphosphate,3'-diphosphate pyrophosphatase
MNTPDTFAAIDLGSNSFHMIIAREVGGQLQLLDRHKETVRLRMGLGADGQLDQAAQERALACLTRFGQRLRGIPSENIRAVGTNTLRLASNTGDFLVLAERALGAQIDIIPGHEEARLIYLGVSHFMVNDDQQRLVMDIGGGSTEFIIGTHFDPRSMTSTEMGCVSISQEFNLIERISANDFHNALTACQLVLRPHAPKLCLLGWDKAIGASGSIKAIDEVLMANGWSNDGITLAGMEKLRDALIVGVPLDKVKIEGLSDNRKPVIGGGLAVLMAAFQLLGIEQMHVSQGALREGLILDMLGRIHHTQDVREVSIRALLTSSRIDQSQAERVARCASRFFEQVKNEWNLNHNILPLKSLLTWAALTHEVGHFISNRKYRHHSAYILENADLAGFNQEEQRLLAWLVLHHRSKMSAEYHLSLPEDCLTVLPKILVLLRLATRLHRGREDQPMKVNVTLLKENQLAICFPNGWLAHNPLTQLDLEIEAKRLEEIGFSLMLTEN